MAITATSYELLKSLPIARGSSLLEIGEANWYGDLDPTSCGLPKGDGFETAKAFYRQWFAPAKLAAIDAHGTPAALKLDLNATIALGERYDVVFNNGTAEHIFNIANVFSVMHEHCNADGWIIHDAPFTGWIDHGFYNLQPTLFYDLASANGYEIHKVAIHEMRSRQIIEIHGRDHIAALTPPKNAMLFVAYRKRSETGFLCPVQGYYANQLSAEGVRAWESNR
jgi:hypothetical protein